MEAPSRANNIYLAGLIYPRGSIQKLVEMGVRTPETRHEGLVLGIETVGCTSVTVGILRTIHGRGHHRHSEASMASIAGVVSLNSSGFSRSPIQQCPGAVCGTTLDKGRNYMSRLSTIQTAQWDRSILHMIPHNRAPWLDRLNICQDVKVISRGCCGFRKHN